MDPAVLGIVGTGLSAVIASLSYWAKTRHDRRRATRVLLYYLLEMHHYARRLSFGTFPEEFSAQCKQLLAANGVTLSEADEASLVPHLRQMLNAYIATELQDLATTISNPFDRALAELSREDPVLAFKRGRDQVMLLSRKLEAVAKSATLPDQPQSALPFHQELGDFGEFLQEAAVAELVMAIRATAWRCDAITHLRVWLELRNAAQESSMGGVRELIADQVRQLVSRQLEERRTRAGVATQTSAVTSPVSSVAAMPGMGGFGEGSSTSNSGGC